MPFLMLKRRIGERVVVKCGCGCVSTVKVNGVQGSRVSLCFDGPRSVVIDREEVYVQKLRDAETRADASC